MNFASNSIPLLTGCDKYPILKFFQILWKSADNCVIMDTLYIGGLFMHTLRNKLLYYGAALAAGFASLGLHRSMMENCFDHKGLLIAGNLQGNLLLAVGAGLVIFLVLMGRTLGGDGTYEDNFPRDYLSGALLLASGLVLILAVPELGAQAQGATVYPGGAALEAVRKALALGGQLLPWLAAGAMAVLGICRIAGRKPAPIFSGVVCLFYMMMLVNNYRLWSADPQIQDYAYQLLGGVLLMLCAFHRTCCDAGIIQRRKLLLTALLAAACCIACRSMPFQQTYYLSAALWGLGCICQPTVLPPDPEPDPEPETEEEAPEADES